MPDDRTVTLAAPESPFATVSLADAASAGRDAAARDATTSATDPPTDARAEAATLAPPTADDTGGSNDHAHGSANGSADATASASSLSTSVRKVDPRPIAVDARDAPTTRERPERWWLAGPRNESLGPYDAVALRLALREGRIGSKSLVCPTGGESWVPARSIPELAGVRPPVEPRDGLGVIVPVGVPAMPLLAGLCALFGMVFWPLGPLALGLGIAGLPSARRAGHGAARAWTSITLGTVETLALAALVAAAFVLT